MRAALILLVTWRQCSAVNGDAARFFRKQLTFLGRQPTLLELPITAPMSHTLLL
jgi:hypothetical protein